MWAILGGSGFEKFDHFQLIEEGTKETPFGFTSAPVKRVRIGSQEALFLSRHGNHHELLPSEINYCANMWALKDLGAQYVLSFSAVGSLQLNYQPGDLVLPLQYLNATQGLRRSTFCGSGLVGHVSLAHPICSQMIQELMPYLSRLDFAVHFGQTYVCIEGPHFSTQAESHEYRKRGADIIGMTHFPEYALAREAGLAYVPCCFVTDYDCWDDSVPHVTLEGIIQIMRENNAKAFRVAELVLENSKRHSDQCLCRQQGLKTSLLTPLEQVSTEVRNWLDPLLKN